MKGPDSQRCDGCYFFVNTSGGGLKGRCHRYPPQVINAACATFPPDVGVDQWCGEFKARAVGVVAPVGDAKVKKR